MTQKGDETPGNKALVAMRNLENDVVFKTPEIPRKKAKKKILDEDSYIEVSFLKLYFMFKKG